jgi:hypothetical protein
MININVAKNSERYKFIESILGSPHTTAYHNGKEIALWYVTEEDKKVLDEMEKENAKV